MDSSLNDVYSHLVKSPNRAELIEAVDAQLKMYRLGPKNYILPNSYKWMTPLIEAFGFDMEGWMHFQRDVIENFGKRTKERMDLQEVYRRVNSRVDAIIRRERLERAIKAHAETHGPFEERKDALEYAGALHTIWKLERMNAIAKFRQDSGLPKISADDKADVCNQYWDDIRAKIDAGKVPSVHELPKLMEKTQALNDLYYGKKST